MGVGKSGNRCRNNVVCSYGWAEASVTDTASRRRFECLVRHVSSYMLVPTTPIHSIRLLIQQRIHASSYNTHSIRLIIQQQHTSSYRTCRTRLCELLVSQPHTACPLQPRGICLARAR